MKDRRGVPTRLVKRDRLCAGAQTRFARRPVVLQALPRGSPGETSTTVRGTAHSSSWDTTAGWLSLPIERAGVKRSRVERPFPTVVGRAFLPGHPRTGRNARATFGTPFAAS